MGHEAWELLTFGLMSEVGLCVVAARGGLRSGAPHTNCLSTCSDSKHWRLVLRSAKSHKYQVFHVIEVAYFDIQMKAIIWDSV